MLSRHFRAHNLNFQEMRLLFSLRCADPGIFVRGGEGGRPDCRKTTATLFLIFNPQLILQFYRGGSSIFQGGPTFSRGGVQMLISIKTHITCDFPEGSGPPVLLLDPRMFEQSLPLEVSTSIPSPCHCH